MCGCEWEHISSLAKCAVSVDSFVSMIGSVDRQDIWILFVSCPSACGAFRHVSTAGVAFWRIPESEGRMVLSTF